MTCSCNPSSDSVLTRLNEFLACDALNEEEQAARDKYLKAMADLVEAMQPNMAITWDNRSPLFDPKSDEYVFPPPADPWAGPWPGDGSGA